MEGFKLMKRRQLQDLCKKHGLPANLKNFEMADNLAALLNKKEEIEDRNQPGSREFGTADAGAGLKNKTVKKVRFSPSNEVFEVVDLVIDDEKKGRADRAKRRASRKGALNKEAESSQQESESSQGLLVGPQVVRMTKARKGILIQSPLLKKKVNRGGNAGMEIGEDLSSKISAAADLGKSILDEVVKCDELRPKRTLRGKTKSNQAVALGTGLAEDGAILDQGEAARKSSRVAMKRKSVELDEQEIGRKRIPRNQTKKRSTDKVTKEASDDQDGAKIEGWKNVTANQETCVPTRPARRSRLDKSIASSDATCSAGLKVNTLNEEEMNGNDGNSKEEESMARPVRRSRRKVPGNVSLDMEDGSSLLRNVVEMNHSVKGKQNLDSKKASWVENGSSRANTSRVTSAKCGPAEGQELECKPDSKKRQHKDAKKLTRQSVTVNYGTKNVPEENVLVEKSLVLQAEDEKCTSHNVPEENIFVDSVLEAEDEKCSNQNVPEENLLTKKSSVLESEDEKCTSHNVLLENVMVEKSSMLEVEDEKCSSQNVREENILVEKSSMIKVEDEKCSSSSDWEIGGIVDTRSCAQTDTMSRLKMHQEVIEDFSITSAALVVENSSASLPEDVPGPVISPSAPEFMGMLISACDGVEVEAIAKSNFSDHDKQTIEQIDASVEIVLGCHRRHEEHQYNSPEKPSRLLYGTQRETLSFETNLPEYEDHACEESAWEADDQGASFVSVGECTVLSTKPERSNLRTSFKADAVDDTTASFHAPPAENASELIIHNEPITDDLVTSDSPQLITGIKQEEDFKDANYGPMFATMLEEPASRLLDDTELSIETKDESDNWGKHFSWRPPSDSVTTSFKHDTHDTGSGSDVQARTYIQDGRSAYSLQDAECTSSIHEVEVTERISQNHRVSPTADSSIDDGCTKYMGEELSSAKRVSLSVVSEVDIQVPCQELATEDLTELYLGNVARNDVITANLSALSPSQAGMDGTNTDTVDGSSGASHSDEHRTADIVKETTLSILFSKEKELQGEKVNETDGKEYLNDVDEDLCVELTVDNKEDASISSDGPSKTLSDERSCSDSPKPECQCQTDDIITLEFLCSDTERNLSLDNNALVTKVFKSAEKTGVAIGDHCFDDNNIQRNFNMGGCFDDYYKWTSPFGDSSLSSIKTVHTFGHKFAAKKQLITEELNVKEIVNSISYPRDTGFLHGSTGLNSTEKMPGDAIKEHTEKMPGNTIKEHPHYVNTGLTCIQTDAKVVYDAENNVNPEMEGLDTVDLEPRKQRVVDINRIDELLQDIDDFLGDETASHTNDGVTTVATLAEVKEEVNSDYQATEVDKKMERISGSVDENMLITEERNAEPVAEKYLVLAHNPIEEPSSHFDTYKEAIDVLEVSPEAVQCIETQKSSSSHTKYDERKCDISNDTDTVGKVSLINEAAQGNECEKSTLRIFEFDESECCGRAIKSIDASLASSLEGGGYKLDGSTDTYDKIFNLWVTDREYGTMQDQSDAHESSEVYANPLESSTTPPKPVISTEKGNEEDLNKALDRQQYPVTEQTENLTDNCGIGLTGTGNENTPIVCHSVEDPNKVNWQPEAATDELDSQVTVELPKTTIGFVEVSFNVWHHEKLAEDSCDSLGSQTLKAEDCTESHVQSEAVNKELKFEEKVEATSRSNTEILEPSQGLASPDTQMTPQNQMSNQKVETEASKPLATELNPLSNSEIVESPTQGHVAEDAQLTPQDQISNQEPTAEEDKPHATQLNAPSHKISYTARKQQQKESQVLKENITPFSRTAPPKVTTNSVAKRRALDHVQNQNN